MRKKILFYGDSITDAGRDRNDLQGTGVGYPLLVKSELGFLQPEQYIFYNKGISGNRIVDLYARMKADCINLSPDYISILIGVNDVWHEYTRQDGVCTEKFERIYSMLIEELQEALPGVRIIILEPFVLPGSATSTDEENPNRLEYFQKETPLRAAAAKRVAEKYGLAFVPLQEDFTRLAENYPNEDWLRDGVHPTPAGHQLIKRKWLEAFRTLG